ncbi:transposase family protein [Polaromonas sp.]|uniref:integrase catalytic domain-containing protein n=1 Tax=Polaromonas sp. TaxID=1869339 RepID=UPI00375186E7
MTRKRAPRFPLEPVTAGALAHVEQLFFELNTPQAGRDYVLSALTDGPSRLVNNKMGNVLVRHESVKAGTVHLESRKGEYAKAILLDIDKDVLTYAPQPPQVSLLYRDADLKVVSRGQYTADFLAVGHRRLVVKEMRDEARLVRLSLRNPEQFYRDDDGTWHFRSAEDHFRSIGLEYELHSNQFLPHTLVSNAELLEDYTLADCPPIDHEIATSLALLIQQRRSVPMRELMDTHGYKADDIFKSIVQREVFVELLEQRLERTNELVIFSDEPTYRAFRRIEVAHMPPPLPIPGTLFLRSGAALNYGGKKFTVVLCGERDVTLREVDGALWTMPLQALEDMHRIGQLDSNGVRGETDPKCLTNVPPEQLDRALKRLDAARTGKSNYYAARTVARFQKAIEGLNDLDALLALVDNTDQKGNRLSKLPEQVRELAIKAIELFYNTPEKRTKKAGYAEYVRLCRELDQEKGCETIPMSYPSFCVYCDDHGSVFDREGKRQAYQKAPILQSLDVAASVHGLRPHQICYVDHTSPNLTTAGPDGAELGKFWLTLAVDGCSRKAQAMIVTYDPPSSWTVLLVLRDYVRRNGCLPRVISADNGADLRGTELEFFCKIYGIDLRSRSPGEPRGGAMIESHLGASQDEVIASCQGNTMQMRDNRLVTQSIDPFKRAIWTLTAIYRALDDYYFIERPNRPHPTLGMTPNQFEAMKIHETGNRTHRFVRFDENLMLMTSPHPRRPYHVVDPRRGVWVNYQWYRHPAMRNVRKGTKVEVRIEPWLSRVVYVQIKGEWVAAIGSSSTSFDTKSSREVELALRQQARKAGNDANKHSTSPEGLRHRERYIHPASFDARISAQQQEMAYLCKQLDLYTAMPEKMLNGAPLLQALPSPAQMNPRASAAPSACSEGMPLAVQSPLHAPAHSITGPIASSASQFQVKPPLPGANLVNMAMPLRPATATPSPPPGESTLYVASDFGALTPPVDFAATRSPVGPSAASFSADASDQLPPTSTGVFDNVPGYN